MPLDLTRMWGTTCDAVMAGWYRQELNFDALEAAVFAMFDGAEFYSASQSLFFATAEGRSLGTSRAISAVVADITGCAVTVVGKPSVEALRTAAGRAGPAADRRGAGRPGHLIPRTAQARAVRWIEPSSAAGSRARSSSRRAARWSSLSDATYAGAVPVPPRNGLQ